MTFPSPTHGEIQPGGKCISLCMRTVALSRPPLCDPMDPHQAPLCMGLPSQEHWSGLPFPPPEHLLDPGIEPAFLWLLL